jgi:glycosyltransferase involved in cell wall biosynthesis
MRTPEISVVMSIYSDAKYLPYSIESILSQEGVDFEFIIVNDSAIDESAEIATRYAADDKRIRIINQTNQGLTKALINGCREARGRFIARQDADDLSMPGRLALQAEMLQSNNRLVFVSCWADVIGPENELLFTYKRPANPEDATDLLLNGRKSPPGHGSVMFRRECYERVGGYRHQLYYAQDGDLWLRFGEIGQLGYVQKVLYKYRISSLSVSGSQQKLKIPFARLVDDLYAARQAGESEEPILANAPSVADIRNNKVASSEADTQYFIGRALVARGDLRAMKYLKNCVCSNPLKLRAWFFLLAAVGVNVSERFKKIKTFSEDGRI